MSGETDLDSLLAGLDPILHEQPYGFALMPLGQALPAGLSPFALISEAEGLTVIATLDDLATASMAPASQWARITMMVHSALEAVGMTAAMAGALAQAGIPANVVAAIHHDHLFVPWPRRHDAVAALLALGSNRSVS
jgi:hypothetical protein